MTIFGIENYPGDLEELPEPYALQADTDCGETHLSVLAESVEVDAVFPVPSSTIPTGLEGRQSDPDSGSEPRQLPALSPNSKKETGSKKGGWRDPSPKELNIMRIYLEEIGHIPILKKEQEHDYGVRVQRGISAAKKLASQVEITARERRVLKRDVRDGESAKSEFIRANLRLVVSIAKKYTGRGLDIEDLIQEGNLGMMHSIDKFDPKKGFRFSTYTTWWIRQAITRGIVDTGRTIRIPQHMVDKTNKLNRTWRRLEKE